MTLTLAEGTGKHSERCPKRLRKKEQERNPLSRTHRRIKKSESKSLVLMDCIGFGSSYKTAPLKYTRSVKVSTGS